MQFSGVSAENCQLTAGQSQLQQKHNQHNCFKFVKTILNNNLKCFRSHGEKHLIETRNVLFLYLFFPLLPPSASLSHSWPST